MLLCGRGGSRVLEAAEKKNPKQSKEKKNRNNAEKNYLVCIGLRRSRCERFCPCGVDAVVAAAALNSASRQRSDFTVPTRRTAGSRQPPLCRAAGRSRS